MVSQETRKYTPTIGIECHVQLKTKTKLFSAVANDAREAAPNTLISHIDLGMPGALPVLNAKAVEYAVRAGLALNQEPQHYSYFERKHYFYPDLPKGYQITQLSHPIVKGGSVTIELDGESKTVHINRVQMEEDAGKSTHPAGKDYSLVDLNRAGTPLLEIVSEPDMHSPAEAKAYVRELYLLMRYANVSDADMYHGNMRFDVNVSVSKEAGKLGTRTETKNLNSFRSVEKTIEFEINRQIEQLENGQDIIQETRGWDDAKQKTFSQRGKEEAHDYRYFPEPDIPPLELEDAFIEKIRKEMPMMPDVLRHKLKNLNLDKSAVETLVEELPAGRFMLEILSGTNSQVAKRIAAWLTTDIQAMVASQKLSWETVKLDKDAFESLAKMIAEAQISSSAAKQILAILVQQGGDPKQIAASNNLLQVSDEAAIINIVDAVISKNPKAAEDVKRGEMKAIGFLVGQVMKASEGRANPGLAQKLIKKQLGLLSGG